MNVFGWVFKLYVRFCVRQFSGKSILFLPSIGQLTMLIFFCQIYVCNGTNKSIQHTEFNFLPVSKDLKVVRCITHFGVSTAIITFFVGGASWTLDFGNRLVFFSTKASHRLKMNNFPCQNLNHPNLFLL